MIHSVSTKAYRAYDTEAASRHGAVLDHYVDMSDDEISVVSGQRPRELLSRGADVDLFVRDPQQVRSDLLELFGRPMRELRLPGTLALFWPWGEVDLVEFAFVSGAVLVHAAEALTRPSRSLDIADAIRRARLERRRPWRVIRLRRRVFAGLAVHPVPQRVYVRATLRAYVRLAALWFRPPGRVLTRAVHSVDEAAAACGVDRLRQYPHLILVPGDSPPWLIKIRFRASLAKGALVVVAINPGTNTVGDND